MSVDYTEILGGAALVALAVFTMTPAFWNLIAWLGSL